MEMEKGRSTDITKTMYWKPSKFITVASRNINNSFTILKILYSFANLMSLAKYNWTSNWKIHEIQSLVVIQIFPISILYA